MKKKLTKDSFMALRSVGMVLDEQQERATKGGSSLDDYGTGYYDSSGNYHWNSTSSGSSSGYYGSSSGSYGSSSGDGYGYGSSSGSNSYSSSQEIPLDVFFNWSGTWNGGYVQGLGYVAADTFVNGSSSGYSSSSPYYNPRPIPNGAETLYMGSYNWGYQLGAAGGFLNSVIAGLAASGVAIAGGSDSFSDKNDPGTTNISQAIWDGYLDGKKARNY